MKRKFAFLSVVGCTCNSVRCSLPLSRGGAGLVQDGHGAGSHARRGWPRPILRSRSPAAQPLEKTFHDVLWADLEYSGILDMVSPSFYPTQVPSQPSELKAADWAAAPANAYMVAYGNMTDGWRESGGGRISLRRAQSHGAAGAAENLSRRGERTPTRGTWRISLRTTLSAC